MPRKSNDDSLYGMEEPDTSEEPQEPKKPKKFSFVPKVRKKAGYSQEERIA